MTPIAIGSDHAGFEEKQKLVQWLRDHDYEVHDFGPDSPASVDYPDYVHPLATAITEGKYERGILLCGSGNGVCISANRHRGIRAALAWLPEIATLARQHNDANVVCIPARFIDLHTIYSITQEFLRTEFEGGRHQRRVEKIEG